MISFDPKEMTVQEIGKILLSGVAPRPIALASTISENGVLNLSPFSFFNAFGQNPPTVCFSPSRRGRDNTVKDTYNNLVATNEVVINAVTYSMVEQINLASCEYDPNVNEFLRAGFTPVDSDIVKPKRVKESPFHLECKVKQIVHLGDGPASGNLTICEVVKMHVAEEVFKDGVIDPQLMDLAGRNGLDYYTRASGDAIFRVTKPGSIRGIGFEGMPDYIKNSHIYTANNLGKLGLVNSMPEEDEAMDFIRTYEPIEATGHSFELFQRSGNYEGMLGAALYFIGKKNPKAPAFLEMTAKCALENGNVSFAWKVAVYKGMIFDK